MEVNAKDHALIFNISYFCKVYLVRFALFQEQDEFDEDGDVVPEPQLRVSKPTASSSPIKSAKPSVQVAYPASISIGELLKAGRLIKPKARTQLTFDIEKFNIRKRQWEPPKNVTLMVEDVKFASGGFRDAFLAVEKSSRGKKYVLKKYSENAKQTITETIKTSLEAHTRKQVQMNSVAIAITEKFSSKVPKEFGNCFSYNNIYYTKWDGESVTLEEFVEGDFVKHINNNGICVDLDEDCDVATKTVYEKAQCLVHFSYAITDGKMMLVDIQGSKYQLYDPEIATKEVFASDDDGGDDQELYFCIGNLSSMAIENFTSNHTCNKYCEMLGIKEKK